MSPAALTTRSLRSARARALAPRAVLYFFVFVLCVAGLRAAVEGPPEPARQAPRAAAPATDLAASSFAEAFARVYLTWEDDRLEPRQRRLESYLSEQLDEDGGLTPARDSSQEVVWTAALGTRPSGERTLVTVAAQTTGELLYLTVPVGRDRRGFMYVAAYPAFVGPPATTSDDDAEAEDEVEDPKLVAVVERAVTNYLARANRNLLADLTPGAVVSLPPTPLRVDDIDRVTWVEPSRRAAVELVAEDDGGNSWTLRYELDVRKRDRWYVRSLQVDPTYEGGAR